MKTAQRGTWIGGKVLSPLLALFLCGCSAFRDHPKPPRYPVGMETQCQEAEARVSASLKALGYPVKPWKGRIVLHPCTDYRNGMWCWGEKYLCGGAYQPMTGTITVGCDTNGNGVADCVLVHELTHALSGIQRHEPPLAPLFGIVDK